MAVEFNHTLVNVRDKEESASFVVEILGLAAPTPYGPFLVVQVANGVSLDFIDVDVLHPQHYAFLVSAQQFDEILARIRGRGLTFWADPFKKRAGEWNTEDGGQGLYWEEPNGHLLEIITRPYGSSECPDSSPAPPSPGVPPNRCDLDEQADCQLNFKIPAHNERAVRHKRIPCRTLAKSPRAWADAVSVQVRPWTLRPTPLAGKAQPDSALGSAR